MRIPFRATVLVGLLALATLFMKPVNAAGPATKIVLSPATVAITADQTQTFVVSAVAADGTTTDVTLQTTLSVNDPVGKISGAVFTPGKAGAWTVQAAYQSFSATAVTTVTAGDVKEIVINPNSEPEQTTIGVNTKFTATAYDAKNNIVAGQTFVWTVTGENGSVDALGVFTPKKVGTTKVQAAIGTVTGQASVVVSPAIVTNTNTVTNTTKNANVAKNVNVVANTNTTNTTSSTTGDEKTTSCTTLKPWVWILILIVFLAAVAVLFTLFPITAIWPSIAALAAAVILAVVQRKYDCNGQTWWAWVIMLGTIALAAAALAMRPKNTPTV